MQLWARSPDIWEAVNSQCWNSKPELNTKMFLCIGPVRRPQTWGLLRPTGGLWFWGRSPIERAPIHPMIFGAFALPLVGASDHTDLSDSFVRTLCDSFLGASITSDFFAGVSKNGPSIRGSNH